MRRQSSSITGPVSDTAVEVALDAAGDRLRAVVEYDEAGYRVLFASGWLLGYLGKGGLDTTADGLHGYIHLDFVERDLYAEMTPAAGPLRTHVTRLEGATFVRSLVDDAGLFLSVDPDTDLTPLCTAVEGAMDEHAGG